VTTHQRDLLEERILASQLIARARAAKLAFRRAFRESAVEPHPAQSRVDVMTRAEEAYGTIRGRLRELQDDFRALDRGLRAETEHSVQSLLHLEVARGACLADGSSPAPFQFLFASARVQNSLGHQARMPNEKLAGLQLGHFGGFLKRSWRANDWLWGRMDGIEHLMRVILDEGTVTSLTPAQRTQLAALAFPDPEHARPDEIEALETRWNTQRASINISGAHAGARTEFAALLADQSSPHRTLACQQALAARLELRVLREDLRRIAETAADDLASGSSRISAGAFWSNRFPLERASPPDDQLVALFKDMDVGKEAVKDETSSRLVLDVSAQTAAVAAAVFAGDRGGLPTIARSALGTIRAASLAVSRLVRLLAREPWVGAAVVAVLIGLLVWAAVAKNTLLGALLPALALLVVAGLLSLLTIATSVFEQSVTTVSRIAGFTLFAGIPIGFFFATRGFHWDHRGVHWFDAHTGEQATSIAAAAAAVAGTAAVARVVFGAFVTLARRAFGAKPGHGWIRTVLLIYRAAVIAALGSLVVGFIIERTLNRHPGPGRWVAVADEKRGTLLIILLLAVLVTAALIEELAAWVRRAIRTLALALKHW